MKNRFLNIIFLIIGLSFFSCSNQPETESFYINPAIENKNLKFICKENNEIQIWRISRNEKNDTIKTKRLNSEYELIDETIEKLTAKGSELISYTFIDRNGEFPLEIKLYLKEKDLLKWDLNEKSIYSGEYIHNGIIFQFNRERTFLKNEKQILIFNDNFEFSPVKEQMNNNIDEFYNWNFTQTTYFKKNKGLIKYERIYLNGEKRKFEIQE